jgi:sugar phosphate isomerase/epimerase
MKTSVTISMVPSLNKGPWIYWEDLNTSIGKAKALGFDAVELFPESAAAVNPAKLAALLQEHGMQLSAIGTGAGKALHRLTFTSAHAEIRARARIFVAEMIEAAAPFRAAVIIGSMQGVLEAGVDRREAHAWLRDVLNELGSFAWQRGVTLLIEPLNRYETDVLNRVSDGVELVRSLDTDGVAILADLFHMNIEEQSLAASIREAAGHIGFVHLADSNRQPAGLGHTNFVEVVEALKAIGYDGYVSAEALPYPSPDEAAAQTISACRALGLGRMP